MGNSERRGHEKLQSIPADFEAMRGPSEAAKAKKNKRDPQES